MHVCLFIFLLSFTYTCLEGVFWLYRLVGSFVSESGVCQRCGGPAQSGLLWYETKECCAPLGWDWTFIPPSERLNALNTCLSSITVSSVQPWCQRGIRLCHQHCPSLLLHIHLKFEIYTTPSLCLWLLVLYGFGKKTFITSTISRYRWPTCISNWCCLFDMISLLSRLLSLSSKIILWSRGPAVFISFVYFLGYG